MAHRSVMHNQLQQPIGKLPWRIALLFPIVLVLLFMQLLIPRSREPYPAILMPAGGERIRITETSFSFKRRDVFLRHDDSTRTMIASEDLLPFLSSPVTRDRVIKNLFGLQDVGLSSGRRIGVGPLAIILRKGKTSVKEADETRTWLRNRVEAVSGKPTNALIVEDNVYRKTFDHFSPELLETSKATVIPLTSR